MQSEYWTVYTPDGRKYADCGLERDAARLCAMVPGRTYHKTKYLQDQVIDVTATTDYQLPGQLGLPYEFIVGEQKLQQKLPESTLEEFSA